MCEYVCICACLWCSVSQPCNGLCWANREKTNGSIAIIFFTYLKDDVQQYLRWHEKLCAGLDLSAQRRFHTSLGEWFAVLHADDVFFHPRDSIILMSCECGFVVFLWCWLSWSSSAMEKYVFDSSNGLLSGRLDRQTDRLSEGCNSTQDNMFSFLATCHQKSKRRFDLSTREGATSNHSGATHAQDDVSRIAYCLHWCVSAGCINHRQSCQHRSS